MNDNAQEVIARALEERFGFSGLRIVRKLDGRIAYHLVLQSERRRLFASLFRASSNCSLSAVREVIRCEAGMTWPQARLVSSYIRDGDTPYIRLGRGVLAVRRFEGRPATKGDDVDRITRECYSHCMRLRAAIDFSARDFRSTLRFSPIGHSAEIIRTKMENEIFPLTFSPERQVFRAALREMDKLYTSTRGVDYVLCHGDLDIRNVVLMRRSVQVIDHQCMHYDLPWIDMAHFFLTLVSGGYFAGGVDRKRSGRFLKQLQSLDDAFNRKNFGMAVRYVLMKKMALVQHPENLRLTERAQLLSELAEVLP